MHEAEQLGLDEYHTELLPDKITNGRTAVG